MAPTARYRATTDLPDEIPLFPLRGVIMLPRADLPLHIFEPRYLAMAEDVIAGKRVIGIIQPEQTAEVVESPLPGPNGEQVALKRIGCAGRLTAFQELPDGRIGISLSGVARFRIEREIPTAKPYRIAKVGYDAFAADLAPDTSAKDTDRERLLRVLKQYLERRKLQADWTAITRAPLEPLINSLAAMAPFGPEEKQALLEAPTLERRIEVLIALAQMELASSGGDAGTTLQ